MTERYIDCRTDYGFKRLFGTERNKALLIDFLNALLEGEEHIRDLTYLNPEQLGVQERERRAVFDVYCRNDRDETFIVEMQNAKQLYFKDRSLYYATFPIQRQAEKGNLWDFNLKGIYAIGILNFVMDDDELFKHKVMLSDVQTGKVFYDKLTFYYLELPKFAQQKGVPSSQLEKWLCVFNELPAYDRPPDYLDGQVFDQLFQEAEIARYNELERMTYEESLKIDRDNNNILSYARMEGHEEGMKEGERQANEKTARKMKEKGFSAEVIAAMTGLERDVIEKL